MFRRSRAKRVFDLLCLLYHCRTGCPPHWWRRFRDWCRDWHWH